MGGQQAFTKLRFDFRGQEQKFPHSRILSFSPIWEPPQEMGMLWRGRPQPHGKAPDRPKGRTRLDVCVTLQHRKRECLLQTLGCCFAETIDYEKWKLIKRQWFLTMLREEVCLWWSVVRSQV